MAIRYVSGQLTINLQPYPAKKILSQTTNDIRNKWIDFKFRVCFTRSGDGYVQAWLNDNPIIKYKGITCYSARGYRGKNYFYFKTGLYRDVMTQPTIIYVNEYRKMEIIKKENWK